MQDSLRKSICFFSSILLALIIFLYGFNSIAINEGLIQNNFVFAASEIVDNYIALKGHVPSGSMENTVQIDDKLIIDKQSYHEKKPKRYDIVVFKFPENEEELFLKRIIGLPGETIYIYDGLVYINDEKNSLRMDFVKDYNKNENLGPFVVPENKYFMMGDNRIDSYDSRYWDIKYVSLDKIIGKVSFRYSPSYYKFKDGE